MNTEKQKKKSPHDPVPGTEVEHPLRLHRISRHDINGRELLDPVPMSPPVGYKKQPSMFDTIRGMVRSARLAEEAEAAGMETFEEADDFDIEDDPPDPSTPYETRFDPAEDPIEVSFGNALKKHHEDVQAAERSEAEKRKKAAAKQPPESDPSGEAEEP